MGIMLANNGLPEMGYPQREEIFSSHTQSKRCMLWSQRESTLSSLSKTIPIVPSQSIKRTTTYSPKDTLPQGPSPRRHLRHPKPWTTIHNKPGDYMPAQSPESHFSRNKIFSQPLNHPNQWRMTSQKGRRKYHGPPSNPTTTRETRTTK